LQHAVVIDERDEYDLLTTAETKAK